VAKRHPELVHHIGIQNILTGYLSQGVEPTTKQLQERHFGVNYDPDSRYQYEVVLGAIERGRSNAINQWEQYVKSNDLIEHINKINDETPERIEEELNSKDFEQFKKIILNGDIIENKRAALKELGGNPVIAVVFNDKVHDYSRQKNNLVISTYGKNASWSLPSFWAWNIREYNLYYRSIEVLAERLRRGIITKVLLPSKQPIKKALEYQTNIRAIITDGTSWRCDNCGAHNIDSMTQCTICQTPREVSESG